MSLTTLIELNLNIVCYFFFGGIDPEYIANMFSAEALDTNVTFAIASNSG